VRRRSFRECYAHEIIKLKGRGASDVCELMRHQAVPLAAATTDVGRAWKTAMANDDECILLWAIPPGEMGSFEAAQSHDLRCALARRARYVQSWQRIVLVAAPLSPLRTGRSRRVKTGSTGGMSDEPDDLILISVDDHICEPPHVRATFRRGSRTGAQGGDDRRVVNNVVRRCQGSQSGFERGGRQTREMFNIDASRYDEMRPGCYDVHERVRT